jgi:DNA-binding CsgD family transcriptional regulator
MTMRFSALNAIAALSDCKDIDSLRDVAQAFAEGMGFSSVHVSAMRSDRAADPVNVLLSTYPDRWILEYQRRGFIEIDPVRRALAYSNRAVQWRKAPGAGDPEAVAFFQAANDAGLADGLTIPVHGAAGYRGYVSFAGPGTVLLTQQDEDALYLFAVYLHEVGRRLKGMDSFSSADAVGVELTDREREILSWVLEGLVDEDIARKLKITHRTVRFHVENAARKLGVQGRHGAANRALELGLLTETRNTSLG